MTLTFRYRNELKHFHRPMVMGILNATPDSFFAGSRQQQIDDALKQAEQMLKEGADVLDIGGQSTRPGAQRISADEESQRVVPVIEAVANAFPEAMISVDTFYAATAADAVAVGAGIVNDVSAWSIDPKLLPTVALLQVPYILMHMQGTPETMQDNPQYTDVVNDIIARLSQKLNELRLAGVNDVWVDPGFGFGKTLEHNYSLLRRLDEFAMLGVPVLAGLSRKGMIWKALGGTPNEALNGTTAANTVALMNGASILRVHDVREAREAVKIVSFVNAES
jgi:dihydropteroate synthase